MLVEEVGVAVRPLVAAVEGVAVVAVEEELCLPTAATTTTAAAGHAVLQHTDDWRGRHVYSLFGGPMYYDAPILPVDKGTLQDYIRKQM